MTRSKSGPFMTTLNSYKKVCHIYFTRLKYTVDTTNQYIRVRELTTIQTWLAQEFKKVQILLQQDPNFSDSELAQMHFNYRIILNWYLENIDQLTHIISSLTSNMEKEQRLELINNTHTSVHNNLRLFKKYHKQNVLTSLKRAETAEQKAHLEKIYGFSKYNNSAYNYRRFNCRKLFADQLKKTRVKKQK